MQHDVHGLTAVFVAYVVALGLWFVFTRLYPRSWMPLASLRLERPVLDFMLALLCIAAIFGLNVLYNLGWLIPSPRRPELKTLAFLGDLVIIWSPIAIVLIWRRQPTHTCLLALSGFWKRLLWAVGASFCGMATYFLIHGNPHPIWLAFHALVTPDPVALVQSLIQYFGFGFLLVRLAALVGRIGGILICSTLYGLAKYPYYLMQLHMSWIQASSLIAFNVLVAFCVIGLIYDRQDVFVPGVVHAFMDAVQTM